jgi:hypothetical protein
MYAFSTEMPYRMAVSESSMNYETTSDATIAKRYSECREICMIALERKVECDGKIGGPGHVVEIDECKISRSPIGVE